MGNPSVVGLAGFGLTTLLLQFHNIGLIGLDQLWQWVLSLVDWLK
jgi:succinate-acetate transporter protein